MSFSDPLGDMLTRIRNSLMRGKSQCNTPASKLRARVLDVLADEGYIRGYAEVEKDGFKEFEIELKYFEGEPGYSGNHAYIQTGSPRIFFREKPAANS